MTSKTKAPSCSNRLGASRDLRKNPIRIIRHRDPRVKQVWSAIGETVLAFIFFMVLLMIGLLVCVMGGMTV